MKLFCCTLFLLFYSNVKATHIVGGEMWYDYISPGTYKIYIALFRDCASTGAQYDNPMSLGVFNSSNNLLNEVFINFPGSNQLPINFSNPCVTAPGGICVEKTVYTTTLSNLPAIPGGYTLAYTRCCRTPDVVNLQNPDALGITITTRIPGSETGLSQNNSPRFTNYPPLVLCAGIDFNFNHSATDPDGDVLVYDLVAPYVGGTSSAPMPQPPPNPPYNLAPWESGYNAAAPLGAGANLTINTNTGILTANPNQIGLFAVGVRVREYRGGVLVGETRRDFLWTIVDCVIQLAAEIPAQNLIGTGNGPCTDLSVQFGNESFNASNYSWNFGDPTTTNDVSTSSTPSYTYPTNGTYVVTLIANPGWPCSDTTTETFIVSEKVVVSILSADSVCITNNMIDFQAIGFTDPSTVLQWNFGSNATPSAGTGQIVNNVVFDTSGFIPITVTASVGACSAVGKDTIFIYGFPTINLDSDQTLCGGLSISLTATGVADLYLWSPNLFLNRVDSSSVITSTPTDLQYIVSASNACGSIKDTVFVDVISPNVTASNDTIICSGNIANVAAEGGINYDWQPASTVFSPTSQSSAVRPKVPTNYIVTGTDIYGCKDTAAVFVNLFPLSFVEASEDQFPVIGDLISLQATANGPGLYSWSPTEYLSCVNCTNPTTSPNRNITYTVTFVDGNNCVVKDNVTIVYDPIIYIPNTFTPDQNDYNNFFFAYTGNVKEFEMKIFNRWGELIWEGDNILSKWDGNHKGVMCPDGTYVWVATYVDFSENKNVLKGNLNLIR
jgi:gliding motility-associated-like protein